MRRNFNIMCMNDISFHYMWALSIVIGEYICPLHLSFIHCHWRVESYEQNEQIRHALDHSCFRIQKYGELCNLVESPSGAPVWLEPRWARAPGKGLYVWGDVHYFGVIIDALCTQDAPRPDPGESRKSDKRKDCMMDTSDGITKNLFCIKCWIFVWLVTFTHAVYYVPHISEVEDGIYWFHHVRLSSESCPLRLCRSISAGFSLFFRSPVSYLFVYRCYSNISFVLYRNSLTTSAGKLLWFFHDRNYELLWIISIVPKEIGFQSGVFCHHSCLATAVWGTIAYHSWQSTSNQ